MAKSPKKPAPKSKVVGEALDWSDADLDALAEITPEDVASAKANFRRLAPKRVRRLLDAKKVDET